MKKIRLSIGIWMDPIEKIKPEKDSSLALLLAAQRHKFKISYLPRNELTIEDGISYAQQIPLAVRDSKENFFSLGKKVKLPLSVLDVILIRADPPFDMDYLYSSQILELAENNGTLIVNTPQSLRDCNEKLYATIFSKFMPPTLVSSSIQELHSFHSKIGNIIAKPLDGMGGQGIFHINEDGKNLGSVIEMLSKNGKKLIMLQQFRPEIIDGDRRILVLNGEPHRTVLARIPIGNETRGNLAAGGKGVISKITDREYEVAKSIGTDLFKRGILLAGIDMIGGFLTEINITSPTCIREIDSQTDNDIAYKFLAIIKDKLFNNN